MEDWDHFRIVLALTRAKTLRGAADVLGINHTTVSRRLSAIAHFYQADLFERVAGNYELTSLGAEVFEAAIQVEKIVESTKRLQRANNVELSGKITLSLPTAIGQYLLVDELAQFQRQYPNISLNIVGSYQLVNLDRCEADVVIRADNNPSEHLVGRRLCNLAVCYYGEKSYLENTPCEHLRWITRPLDQDVYDWVSASPFPNAEIAMQISDLDLRYHAGVSGHGLFRGACYMADQEPKLKRIANCNPTPFQDLWVLTHPDLRNVPRIKLLMDFIAEALIRKKPLMEGKEPNRG